MNLNQVTFLKSFGSAEQLEPSRYPEVSFVGRSNVGKSSLMNALFGRKSLVKVSSKPGSTALINFFRAEAGASDKGPLKGIDFVDLPGYGFAKVSKSEQGRWRPLIEGYYSAERDFALCVLLIDIRHDLSELDKTMLEFLVQHEIPYLIAFTKADKLSNNQINKQMRTLCAQLAVAADTLVLPVSSVSKLGVSDLESLIKDACTQALQA